MGGMVLAMSIRDTLREMKTVKVEPHYLTTYSVLILGL